MSRTQLIHQSAQLYIESLHVCRKLFTQESGKKSAPRCNSIIHSSRRKRGTEIQARRASFTSSVSASGCGAARDPRIRSARDSSPTLKRRLLVAPSCSHTSLFSNCNCISRPCVFSSPATRPLRGPRNKCNVSTHVPSKCIHARRRNPSCPAIESKSALLRRHVLVGR